MHKNNTNPTKSHADLPIDMVGELTPISLREARKLVGESGRDMSDESLLSAILDLTAIARAYIRKVPNYSKTSYNLSNRKVLI